MPVNDLGQPVGEPIAVATANPPARRVLSGSYCELQPLDADAHGAQLFAAFSAAEDDADWTYLPYGPFVSLDGFMQWLGQVEGQADPMFFTVIDGSDGTCAGVASYLRINDYAASIEVGHIHFSRQIQGTRITTEAMFLMMQHAFDSGYRRYEWKCDDLNAPSRAAAQRLGFAYEGTFQQATHYKGRNRDTAWFGLTDANWPGVRTGFERWLEPKNFDEAGRQRMSLERLR